MLILAIAYLSESLSLFPSEMEKIRSNSASIKVYFVESRITSGKLYRVPSENHTRRQSHFQKTIQKDLRTMWASCTIRPIHCSSVSMGLMISLEPWSSIYLSLRSVKKVCKMQYLQPCTKRLDTPVRPPTWGPITFIVSTRTPSLGIGWGYYSQRRLLSAQLGWQILLISWTVGGGMLLPLESLGWILLSSSISTSSRGDVEFLNRVNPAHKKQRTSVRNSCLSCKEAMYQDIS